MTYPRCQGRDIRKLSRTTDLGSVVYRCQGCRCPCNERTGTPFHFLEMPTDLVCPVVLFRLWFRLSWRDLVQMLLIRGYELSHETVRDGEARFAPKPPSLPSDHRKGKEGPLTFPSLVSSLPQKRTQF